ncbi:MAG: hypothetical protein GX234_08305 [Clostridiales bacterium]|nr:hypothetical protein [Clostridiales bacterium]
MKRKLIPPFVMLLAGAVSSIAMYIRHYELKNFLVILLSVLVVSYIIGLLIKRVMDKIISSVLEKEAAEGEVIEKEAGQEQEEDEKTAEEKA